MKIAVGICWYNDEAIFRCIESIPKDWDIIVPYGLFRNSKLKADLSQLQRVESFSNVTVIHSVGETPEYAIRDLYLRNTDADVLLIIDSDEYITELTSEFYDNLEGLSPALYGVNVQYDVIREWSKIIVSPSEFHYDGDHRYFKRDGVTYPISHYKKLINGITLTHDDSVRDDTVKETIEEYQKQMWVNGE